MNASVARAFIHKPTAFEKEWGDKLIKGVWPTWDRKTFRFSFFLLQCYSLIDKIKEKPGYMFMFISASRNVWNLFLVGKWFAWHQQFNRLFPTWDSWENFSFLWFTSFYCSIVWVKRGYTLLSFGSYIMYTLQVIAIIISSIGHILCQALCLMLGVMELTFFITSSWPRFYRYESWSTRFHDWPLS